MKLQAIEVLTLDLEGTLISNAMSQFARPGLRPTRTTTESWQCDGGARTAGVDSNGGRQGPSGLLTFKILRMFDGLKKKEDRPRTGRRAIRRHSAG